MSKYERLTGYMQVGDKLYAIQPQRKERIQAYIDRLFELEDKIEAGTLVELPCIREIEDCFFVYFDNSSNGTIDNYICDSREAAEARLAELKGGKE